MDRTEQGLTNYELIEKVMNYDSSTDPMIDELVRRFEKLNEFVDELEQSIKTVIRIETSSNTKECLTGLLRAIKEGRNDL